MTSRRERRQAMRENVNGRMVATHLPPERHGDRHTYDRWYCRCEPCSQANREAVRAYRARQAERARLRAQGITEELEYLASEYEFMRSFGMNHERACKHIGQDPDTFRRRLERARPNTLAA